MLLFCSGIFSVRAQYPCCRRISAYSESFTEKKKKMNFNKTPMFVDTKLNCQKNAYMSQYDLMIQSLVYTDTDILQQQEQCNQ